MKLEYLDEAVKDGKKTLSEYESKKLLAEYGMPVVREELVKTADDAVAEAQKMGYPVVLKACGTEIAHKTEKKLIELNLVDEEGVRAAFEGLSERAGAEMEGVLVQQMVPGGRELVVGLVRDDVFGPCVMFGIGGIYTELFKDVSFRVAPLEKKDARALMGDFRGKDILGPFRGMKEVDREQLMEVLITMGRIGMEQKQVKEVDVNPLIIAGDGRVIAVDALVAVRE